MRAHVRNREVRVENLVHTRKVQLVEEEVAAAQRIAGRESAQQVSTAVLGQRTVTLTLVCCGGTVSGPSQSHARTVSKRTGPAV